MKNPFKNKVKSIKVWISVVKNKNNTETETKTTINNKQLRPHVTENIGLIEQQKIVMIRDRSTSAQNEPPKRLT